MATSERSEEAVDYDQVDTVELSDPQIRDDRSDVCLAQRKANNEWARRRDVDGQLPETQMFPYNRSTTTTISMTTRWPAPVVADARCVRSVTQRSKMGPVELYKAATSGQRRSRVAVRRRQSKWLTVAPYNWSVTNITRSAKTTSTRWTLDQMSYCAIPSKAAGRPGDGHRGG